MPSTLLPPWRRVGELFTQKRTGREAFARPAGFRAAPVQAAWRSISSFEGSAIAVSLKVTGATWVAAACLPYSIDG